MSLNSQFTEIFTIPRSIAFLRDRFDGKAFNPGCERKDVGLSTVADAVEEAIQFNLPLLVPLLAVVVQAFQSIPAA